MEAYLREKGMEPALARALAAREPAPLRGGGGEDQGLACKPGNAPRADGACPRPDMTAYRLPDGGACCMQNEKISEAMRQSRIARPASRFTTACSRPASCSSWRADPALRPPRLPARAPYTGGAPAAEVIPSTTSTSASTAAPPQDPRHPAVVFRSQSRVGRSGGHVPVPAAALEEVDIRAQLRAKTAKILEFERWTAQRQRRAGGRRPRPGRRGTADFAIKARRVAAWCARDRHAAAAAELKELSGGGPAWLEAAQKYLRQNPGALAAGLGALGTAAFFREEVKDSVAAVWQGLKDAVRWLAQKLEAVVKKIHDFTIFGVPGTVFVSLGLVYTLYPYKLCGEGEATWTGWFGTTDIDKHGDLCGSIIQTMKQAMGADNPSMLMVGGAVLANAATGLATAGPAGAVAGAVSGVVGTAASHTSDRMQRAGQFLAAQTHNPAYGQFMNDSAARVQQVGGQAAQDLETGARQGLAALGVSEDPQAVSRAARAAAGTALEYGGRAARAAGHYGAAAARGAADMVGVDNLAGLSQGAPGSGARAGRGPGPVGGRAGPRVGAENEERAAAAARAARAAEARESAAPSLTSHSF